RKNRVLRKVARVLELRSLHPLHVDGLSDIVVLHDELDLPPGKVRLKTGGGAAGHNGLRSIGAHMGNDFRRVRIGIGHPGAKELVHNYVLQDFAKAERDWVATLCDVVADNAGLLAKGQDSTFQNKVHLAMQAKGFLGPDKEPAGGAGAGKTERADPRPVKGSPSS
ncbi:aminoacyl-tRNA hydrolase, partial [Rhodoplanes roseus]|uniref:aminoacyl-tRNA hydrolase n=1 Tax=Rhodoplanes roseus TaxID=29409 RepID=UPI0011B62A8E